MSNRWGIAAFALVFLATPLAAQEPSLDPSDPAAIEEQPLEVPEPQVDTDLPNEDTIDDEPDWSLEPSVDVTELRTSLEERLPKAAPPPPAITNILPVNTPAAMIVNTRDDAWATLKRYALFSQLSERFGVEPSPQALPLLPLGMDYAEDVQPWIGDSVAFALLPVPSIRTINPVERSVTIVPIQNAADFIDFIPTLAEVRGALPEQISYRTFPIWHWPEEFVPYDYPWDDFPEEEPERYEINEFIRAGVDSISPKTRKKANELVQKYSL